MLRVPVRDLTGGLKCFRAEALEAIDFRTARARGYAFQVELTYRALRAGLRVVEVPITFRERREGESKMTGHVALEAAWRVPALRLQPRATEAARGAADPQGMRSMPSNSPSSAAGTTRARTLRRWRRAPARHARRPWVKASLGVAVLLLLATWAGGRGRRRPTR